MADISRCLDRASEMIGKGQYFTINRGRQYGKTTTLYMLERALKEQYWIISISFEASDDLFQSGWHFSAGFVRMLRNEVKTKLGDEDAKTWDEPISKDFYLSELSDRIGWLCERSPSPVVLMIDEVDKNSDNQIFVTFLGLLRNMYLERQKNSKPAFHSVILAGVHDVRHLKLRIRPDEEHKNNSPWNIAVPFDEDMSISAGQIKGMLEEYEADHGTGMDLNDMSEGIYAYTSGYPFLVSKICKILDETGKSWNRQGLDHAVRSILNEGIPLFESMKNRLLDHPDMRETVKEILFSGNSVPDNPDDEDMSVAKMYGFIRARDGFVAVANRIFETRLYNYFMANPEVTGSRIYRSGAENKNMFIKDRVLDMDLVLQRFIETYADIYGSDPVADPFLESDGRRLFLMYVKPIINGTGNYYVEAATRDLTRTDLIVDYLGIQYVIELKIWRGNSYNERGEKQLAEYLEYFHVDKGWMLSFCFNKNKKTGIKTIRLGDKTIVEGIV